VAVSIRKFRIIVLVANLIEYWSNYSIRNFEYSHSTSCHQCKLSDTEGHVEPGVAPVLMATLQDMRKHKSLNEKYPQHHFAKYPV